MQGVHSRGQQPLDEVYGKGCGRGEHMGSPIQ